MPRPRSVTPTPAELRVLQVLWSRGPSSVREVLGELNESGERAYTTVMSLMAVMEQKRLLRRRRLGRAFVYEPREQRESTLGHMLSDILGRAFSGSAHSLVAHLLQQASPSDQELHLIRQTLDQYAAEQGTEQSADRPQGPSDTGPGEGGRP